MKNLLASRLGWLTRIAIVAATALPLCYAGVLHGQANDKANPAVNAFLGFDRNDYPGDDTLLVLRRTFSFTGFWLNTPPGAKNNSWTGKRDTVKQAGFGFLLLFNGRLDKELRKASNASDLGRTDAEAAVAAARHEGFSNGSVIFLDQEEGGLLLPEQKAYIYAWVDGVNGLGYRAGIYCSGQGAQAGNVSVVTANDLRENAAGRNIEFWVANDSCPPSPGCSYPHKPPLPSDSGTRFATVWQYAQSPRRRDFARGCTNYAPDENCYPSGLAAKQIFVDLNSATSPDPSHGR